MKNKTYIIGGIVFIILCFIGYGIYKIKSYGLKIEVLNIELKKSLDENITLRTALNKPKTREAPRVIFRTIEKEVPVEITKEIPIERIIEKEIPIEKYINMSAEEKENYENLINILTEKLDNIKTTEIIKEIIIEGEKTSEPVIPSFPVIGKKDIKWILSGGYMNNNNLIFTANKRVFNKLKVYPGVNVGYNLSDKKILFGGNLSYIIE